MHINAVMMRSSANIKYIFDNVLLSELLLNKTISNIYLILVDERSINLIYFCFCSFSIRTSIQNHTQKKSWMNWNE